MLKNENLMVVADSLVYCVLLRLEREHVHSDGNLSASEADCNLMQNTKVLCEIKTGKANQMNLN